jgi:hypothetical protein
MDEEAAINCSLLIPCLSGFIVPNLNHLNIAQRLDRSNYRFLTVTALHNMHRKHVVMIIVRYQNAVAGLDFFFSRPFVLV